MQQTGVGVKQQTVQVQKVVVAANTCTSTGHSTANKLLVTLFSGNPISISSSLAIITPLKETVSSSISISDVIIDQLLRLSGFSCLHVARYGA